MKIRHQAAVLGIAVLAAAPLHAQEWKHEVAPYMWASAMSGSSTIGPLEADVDMSFGDILDDLEFGFMGTYRGTRDRFSVSVDVVYMALSSDFKGPQGYVKGEVDVDQTALEVNAGWEIIERLTVFGGLRYNDLSTDIAINGPLGKRKGGGDEKWVDPIVGAHYTIPLADKWSFTLRGDVGGFGIGSKFAWQGIGTLRWQLREQFGLLAAYRYVDMDYENDDGVPYFVYDMAISGPALGAVFTF